MITSEELMQISEDVSMYLREYVKIHDNVFAGSIRHIIPIPWLFKPIHFDIALSRIDVIGKHLEDCAHSARRMALSCTGEKQEYFNLLSEYLDSLITTINLFKPILNGLCTKLEKWRNYRWRTYKADVARYKQAAKVYLDLGGRLNTKLRSLTL